MSSKVLKNNIKEVCVEFEAEASPENADDPKYVQMRSSLCGCLHNWQSCCFLTCCPVCFFAELSLTSDPEEFPDLEYR